MKSFTSVEKCVVFHIPGFSSRRNEAVIGRTRSLECLSGGLRRQRPKRRRPKWAGIPSESPAQLEALGPAWPLGGGTSTSTPPGSGAHTCASPVPLSFIQPPQMCSCKVRCPPKWSVLIWQPRGFKCENERIYISFAFPLLLMFWPARVQHCS